MYLRDEIIFFSKQLREGFCIPLKLVNEDIVYRSDSGTMQIDFNKILIPLTDNDLWLEVANIHQIFNEINQFTEETPAHTIDVDDLEDLHKSISEYKCPVVLNVDKNGNVKEFDPPQIPKAKIDGPEEETNRTEHIGFEFGDKVRVLNTSSLLSKYENVTNAIILESYTSPSRCVILMEDGQLQIINSKWLELIKEQEEQHLDLYSLNNYYY